jgi:hypothetical protein
MAGPSNMIEICSASGTRWVSGDGAGAVVADLAGAQFSAETPSTAEPATSPLLHLEHCPFCMTHAATLALPSPSMTLFAVQGGHDLFPALFYHSPSPLFSWSAARPRGPPAAA